MRAAAAVGPNTGRPRSRNSSATPATSGCSGPMMVRSIRLPSAKPASPAASVAPSPGTFSATSAVPALPGTANRRSTSGLWASVASSACSRPPLPTTAIRIVTPLPIRTARSTRPAAEQGLLAPRADADGGHRHPAQLLDGVDVHPGRPGQVLEPGDAADVLPPALEQLVDRLGVVDLGLGHGPVLGHLAVDPVGDGHRDPFQAREHVQLGHEQLGEPVDPGRVAEPDRVQPAAAPGPAGGGAELVTGRPQRLGLGLAGLGRERARPDPGHVRLGDAHDPLDPARADPGPGQGPAGHRRGGGDERVGAVVDVEQGRLGALEQHLLALAERVPDVQGGVGDPGPQGLGVGGVLLDDRLGVQRQAVVDLGQQRVALAQHGLDLLGQDPRVEQVLDADAEPADLVAVGGADAPAGGADPLAARASAR